MAKKFTDKEMVEIHQKLKEAARQCAASVGVRKTTVDKLCAYAGISKGAFYKFFNSKEALFFEVLEDWHTLMYGGAKQFMQAPNLTHQERVRNALLFACQSLQEASMLDFYENDVPLLLRSMPQEVLDAHYHSDEVHITDLIKASGIQIKVSPQLVAAVVRVLFLSLTHQSQIGPLYPQVLELLVHGVCGRLIDEQEG